MMHRIREAWGDDDDEEPFDGPVEVDEAYFGGKRKNMSNAKRKELAGTGRGTVGKTAVIGMKDRDTNQVRGRGHHRDPMARRCRILSRRTPRKDATVYTDEGEGLQGDRPRA